MQIDLKLRTFSDKTATKDGISVHKSSQRESIKESGA